jgi:hypothetical protein
MQLERRMDARLSARNRMRTLVLERPILCAIGAGAIGAAIGGLLLGRAARLVFMGMLGYLASDLLNEDGRRRVLAKLDLG